MISQQEYEAYLAKLPDVSNKIFGRRGDYNNPRKKKGKKKKNGS